MAANRAAVLAYGYQQCELENMFITDLRPADGPALVRKQMDLANLDGILFQTNHRRKDGREFPVEVSSTGIIIAGERYLLSIIRDISWRRQMEEQLRESEQKYRLLFETIRDVVFIVTRDGTIEDMNEAVEDVFGYTREELLGRRIISLYSDPNERAEVTGEIEQNGFISDRRVDFKKKDGTVFPAAITAVLRRDVTVRCWAIRG